jgi:serine/threonine protein kinase
MGTFRAIKIVHRRAFEHDRPFEREFEGIQKFEPISRGHPSQLNILHVGRNDTAGYFYYVMELADDAGAKRSGGVVESGSDAEDGQHATTQSSQHSISHPLRHSVTPALQDPSSYTPRTLKVDLQRRGRLPVEECVGIGRSLSTALAHLHKNGLVHRDIKPSNIIFVSGVPKLADIGLVTDVDASRSFVGTEGYLPPEGPGTPQADIYSLGKVLYELCTGKDRKEYPTLPANLRDLPESEQRELMELNAVLVKACATEPRQRYPGAEAMQADLAQLQAGRSVSRKRKAERRWKALKRLALALATLVTLALGVSSLVSAFHGDRSRQRPSVQKQLTTNLEALDAYSKGRYKYKQNSDADITNAIQFFGQAIALDPNLAEAWAGLASCYGWLDAPRNWPKVREPAEKALALNHNLAEAHKNWAFVLYTLDWRWAEAEKEFTLAIRLEPGDGEALRGYGYFLKNMGRTKEAIARLRQAHERDPTFLGTTEMLGEAFFDAGDYAQALREYQTCLDVEPKRASTRTYMARVYEAQDLFREAIDLYQQDAVLTGEDQKAAADRCAALRRAYDDGGSGAYWQKNLELDRADPTLSACELAIDFAHVGDNKSLFEQLELAYKKHEVELVQTLKSDRVFDKFRKEPQFIALLKKMKWE